VILSAGSHLGRNSVQAVGSDEAPQSEQVFQVRLCSMPRLLCAAVLPMRCLRCLASLLRLFWYSVCVQDQEFRRRYPDGAWRLVLCPTALCVCVCVCVCVCACVCVSVCVCVRHRDVM
jgi:hypothetical protein